MVRSAHPQRRMLMRTVATVSTKALKALLGYGRAHGLDPAALLETVGLDSEQLEDPEGRITREQWTDVWRALEDGLGDHVLPLHIAETLPFGAFDVMDYLAITSATVGAAFERVVRHFRLIHDQMRPSLTVHDDVAVYRHELIDDRVGAARYSAEFTIACMLQRFRRGSGQQFPIREVRFRHACPGDPAEYERILGGRVRFEQPHDELVLPREVLQLRLLRADPLLNEVLARHAEQLMRTLPEEATLSEIVRREIDELLVDGDPGVETVARRLGMSARTLQRRLKDEDATFGELLDETRRETAIRLLEDAAMPISEVSFLLGFSDPSAFHRAFRRWTGVTPGDVRRGRVRVEST